MVLWFAVCVPSPLLGTLPVSYLAAEFYVFCHLSQCLAHVTLDECLLGSTVTFYVSQIWHNHHSASHFQPVCITYTHFTSALSALYSQQCHTRQGTKLQDSGNAEPPSVVRLGLPSSDFTLANSVSVHFLGLSSFPVLRPRCCQTFLASKRKLVLLHDMVGRRAST